MHNRQFGCISFLKENETSLLLENLKANQIFTKDFIFDTLQDGRSSGSDQQTFLRLPDKDIHRQCKWQIKYCLWHPQPHGEAWQATRY